MFLNLQAYLSLFVIYGLSQESDQMPDEDSQNQHYYQEEESLEEEDRRQCLMSL